MKTRLSLFAIAAVVMIVGLVLRLGPWTLPLWAHHFGGGFLWGAMIYLIVAAFRPTWFAPMASVGAASLIVVVIEGSRLYHTPSLDLFRTTLAGQLLLGHIFSAWNILADEAGVLVAAVLSRGMAGASKTDRLGRLD